MNYTIKRIMTMNNENNNIKTYEIQKRSERDK